MNQYTTKVNNKKKGQVDVVSQVALTINGG